MITASRKITFKKKNGKRSGDIQTIQFSAFQTPTLITYEIIKSNDPRQAYIDWVLKNFSLDEVVYIYEEDDLFGEKPPVGTKMYNAAKEHVENFLKWMTEVEEEGYTVKFEVI
jgi:hypothetical protein